MYNQFETLPPPPSIPRAFNFKVAPWSREFDILNLRGGEFDKGGEFESRSQFARFCQSALSGARTSVIRSEKLT